MSFLRFLTSSRTRLSGLSYLGKGTFMSPTLSFAGREMQDITGGEYDVVMWSPRDEALAEADDV